MTIHNIRWGDTLSSLAQRYNTSVEKLARDNGISNPDLIFAGRTLKISDGFDGSSALAGRSGTGGSSGTSPSGVSSNVGEIGAVGGSLADAGRRAANEMNSTGWCAAGVNRALRYAGLPVNPLPSAYMYGDVLARDSRFREVSLTDEQIRQLPPGAIVVSAAYNSPGNPHGHIAITLGNGMESSDHVAQLSTAGTQRVFIPV